MIHKDTCRIHNSNTGNKRISFTGDFSTVLDLPMKTKLLAEFDDETGVLVIRTL